MAEVDGLDPGVDLTDPTEESAQFDGPGCRELTANELVFAFIDGAGFDGTEEGRNPITALYGMGPLGMRDTKAVLSDLVLDLGPGFGYFTSTAVLVLTCAILLSSTFSGTADVESGIDFVCAPESKVA